jgi:hypothetical protein
MYLNKCDFFHFIVSVPFSISIQKQSYWKPLSMLTQGFRAEFAFFSNHILLSLFFSMSSSHSSHSFVTLKRTYFWGMSPKHCWSAANIHTIKTPILEHFLILWYQATCQHFHLVVDLCISHSFWLDESGIVNQTKEAWVLSLERPSCSLTASCLCCMAWAEGRAKPHSAYVCLDRTWGRLFVSHLQAHSLGTVFWIHLW